MEMEMERAPRVVHVALQAPGICVPLALPAPGFRSAYQVPDPQFRLVEAVAFPHLPPTVGFDDPGFLPMATKAGRVDSHVLMRGMGIEIAQEGDD